MISKSWNFAEPRFCTGLKAEKIEFFLHRYESCFTRFRGSEIRTLAHFRTFDLFEYFKQPEENLLFHAVRYTKKKQKFATKLNYFLSERETIIRCFGIPTVAR